jgi:Tfp pilus assembly protein PilF
MNHVRLLAPLLLLAFASSATAQSFNSDAEARFNIGMQHLREGRIDLAIDTIRQAIKADPKNAFFYKGLGTAYTASKKYAAAIEAFRKAIEINPYYVDVRNDLGTALIISGKRDEGKKEFLNAYSDPTNPTPEITARNLGSAYFEEKNFAESLKWYNATIARNKNYADGYLGAADALVGLGRLEEALSLLESGARANPNDPTLMLALGESYLKAGRFSEARQKFEATASKDPGGPAGRRALELLKTIPK